MGIQAVAIPETSCFSSNGLAVSFAGTGVVFPRRLEGSTITVSAAAAAAAAVFAFLDEDADERPTNEQNVVNEK
jgi:hypothetical protein